MTKRKGDYITTVSGRYYWPLDPRVEEVFISDIAHALSMQCRFGGHLPFFYSVAQHSVLVANILPSQERLVGLLHDASEAYIQDVVRPIKNHLTNYKEIERLNEVVIFSKFGLSYPISDAVKEADDCILATEWRDMRTPRPDDDVQKYGGNPIDNKIVPWSPEVARKQFLDMFYSLTVKVVPNAK